MRAIRVPVTILALTFSPFASAQPIIIADSGDSAWMLVASALALLLAIPSAGLFHGGLTRSRSISSGLMHGIVITSLVSLVWAVAGYSLAFGDGSLWLGGLGNIGLTNLFDIRDGTTIPENLFVLFQLTLAVFTSALVLSAFGDRLRLGWVIGFSCLWGLFVYVPVARWMWGGGWLAERGTLDFAGGIVVHSTAGVAALVIALLLGKRAPTAEPVVADHSVMAMAGAALLWVGSLALNGGSSLAASADAASAILNTHLAASAAALLWLSVERFSTGKSSSIGLVMGAVAGLAAIAPAAGFVGPLGAILLGCLGSFATYFAVRLLKRSLELRGALHVFAVHGIAGIVGSLLFPLFVLPVFGGPGFDEGVTLLAQFGAQAIGVGTAILWTAVMTAIIALMVAMIVPMRANEPSA